MAIRLKKVSKVIGMILAAAICLLAILALVNLAITSYERSKYSAPGKMVEIDGKRIHIYSQGSGPKNVVLLGGWGTASPVLDFGPLIRALKNDFTVTVVENFGYGWSDWSNRPATNKNVVEEMRLALRRAAVFPPYVLVPHSLSGLTVLYYAHNYPDEIEAIVNLENTVPEQYRYYRSQAPFSLPRILRVTGLLRLLLLIDPKLIGYNFAGYADADRRSIAMMYIWNFGNNTQRNEYTQVLENARQLVGFGYPMDMPIGIILSRESIEQTPKTMPGLDWKKAHEELVAGNMKAKIFILDGGHYIHWNNADKIADIIKETIRRSSRGQAIK